MLSDHHFHSVNPPDGELDGPAVEPDDAHDVLIDKADCVPLLKYSFSLLVCPTFLLSFVLAFPSFSNQLRHSSFQTEAFYAISPIWEFPEKTGNGVLKQSWMGFFLFFANLMDRAYHSQSRGLSKPWC